MLEAWQDFIFGIWQNEINVQDFIQKNYKPYISDETFLKSISKKTEKLWNKCKDLLTKETDNNGILEIDSNTPNTTTSFSAGYIDKENEVIVGLQTDKPLKRAIMPFGGLRIIKNACKENGTDVSEHINEVFTKYRRTHNDGVFSAYTPEIRKCRHNGILTGLPDAYGRGRIIGDYRRIALYGIDKLIEDKQKQKSLTDGNIMDNDIIREREELTLQIEALYDIKHMALNYNIDISQPAKNALEAVQWLYFGYLAAIKDQDGAAMSLGRVSTFLDIYIERDLELGILTEEQAQELIDQFVIKLRMVRFLRTEEYNHLFSGDPIWVTESIGGMGIDGRTLVTKNSFRILHTLINLGPAPEPNLTVLWSLNLPRPFKEYCAKISMGTSSIQYENDDILRKYYGDDYGIACCVSPMKIGKEMQFFGARANLAKALLYAINGGIDEMTENQVAPKFAPITSEYLNFDEVMEKYEQMLDWLAKTYINALNIIHYMHDKYNYEKAQLALYDREIHRTMGCGIAGLSVVADSLSAIKYAKVKVIRNENGIVTNFEINGDFPKYGNDIDDVDNIAINIIKLFKDKLKQYRTYRNAEITQSILTITSNVVYGKKTGNTPDGRKAGQPFAPGANPLHGRDTSGAIAALNSVAKLNFSDARDGISNTFSIVPQSLGREEQTKIYNLCGILDGYMKQDGYHLNINVLNKETLLEAMEHPENYQQLTIRVSGYAVNFVKLTKVQQLEVISRTFHSKL